MFLVVEKMGAAAVDEDDELLLVFWRLGAGAVGALIVLPVVVDRNWPILICFKDKPSQMATLKIKYP